MKVVNTVEATNSIGKDFPQVWGRREDGQCPRHAILEVYGTFPALEITAWKQKPRGKSTSYNGQCQASLVYHPFAEAAELPRAVVVLLRRPDYSQPNDSHDEVFLGWPRSFDQRRRDTMRRARGSRGSTRCGEAQGEYCRVKRSGGTRPYGAAVAPRHRERYARG